MLPSALKCVCSGTKISYALSMVLRTLVKLLTVSPIKYIQTPKKVTEGFPSDCFRFWIGVEHGMFQTRKQTHEEIQAFLNKIFPHITQSSMKDSHPPPNDKK